MRRGDAKHLFGCMAIATIVSVGLALIWKSYWILLIAFIVSMGIGIAYEYWQKYTGKTFEKRDILFDFVGTMFGIALAINIISILIN